MLDSVLCNEVSLYALLLGLRFTSKHLLFHSLSLPVSKCVHLALLMLIGSPELRLPASTADTTFYGDYEEVGAIKKMAGFICWQLR